MYVCMQVQLHVCTTKNSQHQNVTNLGLLSSPHLAVVVAELVAELVVGVLVVGLQLQRED